MRRTAVDHAACVFASARLQLIHNDLPNAWITARRTILIGAKAAVRHLKVQRVRPQWWIRVRRHHGRIIDKTKFLHHEKLTVPADAQEGYPHAPQLLHAHTGKLVNNIRLADHLIKPILNGGILGPPELWTAMTAKRKKFNCS